MNLLVGINPVAKVLALALLTTPLLLSVDAVSAGVVLAATIVFAPACGVSWPRLVGRSWPILIAAPLAAVSMALFGNPSGHVYWQWGLFHVTDNSVGLAAAILVRVLAIGVPVAVLTADIDPTELGDGLAQVLRLPARFVVATIASVRLVGLLRDDLAGLRMARRARGLSDRRGPRYYFSLVFGLLVSALRRAGKLSTAMEARGFGAGDRTWARESRLHWRDYVVIAAGAFLGIGAVAVAVWSGDFRFLWVA